MVATLNKIINELIDNATTFQGAKLADKDPTLSIITGVPRLLDPSVDFDWNGKLLYSDTKAETLKQYGNTPLEELLDGSELKLIWSPEKIVLDQANLFKTHLVIRIRKVVSDDTKSVVTYTVLRNAYGSSLVEQTIEVTQ